MVKQICCPDCGCKELQISSETQISTKGKNYSTGQGCLGYLLLGPLGLLCGNCGKGQTISSSNVSYWNCSKCGKKFMTFDCYESQIADWRKKGKISSVMGCIIGVICAILFYTREVPFLPILFLALAILSAVPKLNGSYKVAEELEEELYILKTRMEKFTK